VQARVEAAGGQILFWNGVRVMGVLAVSRAIGDHCLRPFVIAQPEVRDLWNFVTRTLLQVQGLDLVIPA
jgi:Protein phosphatase 2C